MRTSILLGPAIALLGIIGLEIPRSASADVTVIFAPAAPPSLPVARTVPLCEASFTGREVPASRAEASSEPQRARDRSRRDPEPASSQAEASSEALRAGSQPPGAAAIPVSTSIAAAMLTPEPPAAGAADRAADSAPRSSATATVPTNGCTVPRAVVVVRAGTDERAELRLTDCTGAPDPTSLAMLSVLARPPTLETPPSARDLEAHADDPDFVAPGIRRLHPGLAERLRALADRFPGHALEIVAGFRPDAREGSRHRFGLAIDVRVRGVGLDAVHAFVTRFARTGVGLYRAGGFVHLDVRPRSLHWVEMSEDGPGPRIAVISDRPRAPVIDHAAPIGTEPAPAAVAFADAMRAAASPAGAAPGDGRPTESDDALLFEAEPARDADAIAGPIVRALRDLRIEMTAPIR